MSDFWQNGIDLSPAQENAISAAYNQSIWQRHLKVFELTGNPWLEFAAAINSGFQDSGAVTASAKIVQNYMENYVSARLRDPGVKGTQEVRLREQVKGT
ncbi:hypothetical protein [Nisaea sediminum]|uniref:hypothetical protein n=1 Tax=Nisaea sediminum TaxID=2775867 RepID=UPI001868C0D4|nr:hypothetical protein [Nisaea sediminum]